MSGSKKPHTPVIPDPDDAAKRNSNVDIQQLREATKLLDELTEQGVSRPHYDIASPYGRRPVRHRR
jgi:hypothetical protein